LLILYGFLEIYEWLFIEDHVFLRFLLVILDRRSKACRHCSCDGRTGRGQLLAGQNFPRNAFDFELVECQSLDRPGGNEEK